MSSLTFLIHLVFMYRQQCPQWFGDGLVPKTVSRLMSLMYHSPLTTHMSFARLTTGPQSPHHPTHWALSTEPYFLNPIT